MSRTIILYQHLLLVVELECFLSVLFHIDLLVQLKLKNLLSTVGLDFLVPHQSAPDGLGLLQRPKAIKIGGGSHKQIV